jgi:hypothetical protein
MPEVAPRNIKQSEHLIEVFVFHCFDNEVLSAFPPPPPPLLLFDSKYPHPSPSFLIPSLLFLSPFLPLFPSSPPRAPLSPIRPSTPNPAQNKPLGQVKIAANLSWVLAREKISQVTGVASVFSYLNR